MGPKKKNEEVVDLSTLPTINTITSSLLLDFNWQERRFKILENIYKSASKNLSFITRDQLIDFAKEKTIFVDETDYKKNPNAERKEPTNEELAAAFQAIVIDRSIPLMKDKKILLDKIDELRKQKEELINKLNNPEPILDNKKKQPDPKKKKDEITNPDDIIIPTMNEYDTDLIICFLNYPVNEMELKALEAINTGFNNITLIKDLDPYVEPVEEIVDPKDKKKQAPKQEKISPEVLQMQKLFSLYKDINYKELYSSLQHTKMTSGTSSFLRNCFMEELDFTYELNEENKIDTTKSICSLYLKNLELQNKYFLHFEKWSNLKSSLQPMTLTELFNFASKRVDFLNGETTKQNDDAVRSNLNSNNNIIQVNQNKLSKNNVNNPSNSKEVDPKQSKNKLTNKEPSSKSLKQIDKDKEGKNDMSNINEKEEDEHSDINMSNRKQKAKIEDFLTQEQLYLLKILEENKEINSEENYLITKINKALLKSKSLENISLGLPILILAREILSYYRDQQTLHDRFGNEKVDNNLDHLFFDLEKKLEYNFSTQLINLNTNSHLGIENMEETELVERSMHKSINDMSSAFRLIIDYSDDILKQNLENKLENELIVEKEKALHIFSQLPGINRYLMETPPLKEEHYRKALKCEIYPFLNNIPIPVYEKFMSIYAFELMMKVVYPERENLNFGDRKYIQVMNRDILSQVLGKIDLYDAEVITKYNDRDDSLMLSAFYRNPKGRVYHKMLEHRYLSKPEFQNWVKKFEPTPVYPDLPPEPEEKLEPANPKDKKVKEKEVKKNDKNVGPEFKVIDANTVIGMTMKNDLPDNQILYLADDNKVGKIREKIKYMFPNDNGIFVRKIIEHGIYTVNHNYVVKDNLVFGIRYNKDNKKELWVNFENGIKMTATYASDYNNSYNEIFKDELEIRKREQLGKLIGEHNIDSIAQYGQSLKEGDINANNEEVNANPVSTNNHQAESNSKSNINNNKKVSYSNTLLEANQHKGTLTTFMFPDGLEIQILPSGDVLQRHHKIENDLNDQETHRIVTSKASVLSYYQLGSIKIFYANGNVCNISNNIAVNTNNKGYKIQKSLIDNAKKELEPVSVTIQTDPETNTRTLIRDDKTMVLKFMDESQLTIHSDNTKIYTYPTKNHYIVEHDDFASVEVRIDERKKMMKTEISEGSIDSLMGYDDLITRTYDGKLTKTILPDRTEVFSYKEKKATGEFEQFSFNTIVIVVRTDGTIVKTQQDGDVVIITSKERELLNTGELRLFEERKDTDYLFEIFGKIEERKGGVYSADLKRGILWTTDKERNIFELHVDGTAKEKLNASLDLDLTMKKMDEITPKSPKREDYIIVDREVPNFDFNVKLFNDNPNTINAVTIQEPSGKQTIQANKANNNSAGIVSKKTSVIANKDSTTFNAIANANLTNNNNNNFIQKKEAPADAEMVEYEYLDPESIVLKIPENLFAPRLIVINNDNTGYEILNEDQIDHFRKNHTLTVGEEEAVVNDQSNKNLPHSKSNLEGEFNYPSIHCKYYNENYSNHFVSHYWIEKHFNIPEMIQETHRINNVTIPKSLEKITSTPLQRKYPNKEIYLYKNLIEHQTFDEEFRVSVMEAIKARDDWFSKKAKDFGLKMNPNRIEVSEDIKEKNRNIQMRILGERQNKDFILDYNSIQNSMNIDKMTRFIKENQSIIFDINKHVQIKQDRIIHEYSDLRRMPLDLEHIELFSLLASMKENKLKPKSIKGKGQRKSVIERSLKANQEIRFVSNYFSSEDGVRYLQTNPPINVIVKKKKIVANNENPNNNNSNNFNNMNINHNLSQSGSYNAGTNDNEKKSQTNANMSGINEEAEFGMNENNMNNSEINHDFNSQNNYFYNNINENESLENKVNKQQSSIVSLKGKDAVMNDLLENPKAFLRSFNRKPEPSRLKKIEEQIKLIEMKKQEDAYNYLEVKKYKYNVDGQLRKDLPDLQYIKTTFPEAEFNEDYIYIEKMTDPRLKTSSVARRLYFNAPSINEIRKNGQHDFLLQAIDQKRTYDEMMERLNLMITSELCDPMNKHLKIDPIRIYLGNLVWGGKYQASITIRNDDNLSTRVLVRKEKPESKALSIELYIGGKVSHLILIINVIK